MEDRVKLFNSPVISISQEQTLQDALFSMRKGRIRHLVVSHKAYPVGIITEHDIAKFLEDDKLQRNPQQVLIQEAMVRNVIKMVYPSEDLLKNCAKKMQSLNIGSIVIIDKENQLGGIVTKSILVHNYPRFFEKMYKVYDFINAVVTCRPEDDAKFALHTMRRHRISRLIVTDNNGVPLGVVTYQNFLNSNLTLDNMTGFTHENIFLGQEKKEVLDIMEENMLYVKTTDDMEQATKIMEKYNVSGVPVVDDSGKLEGVVSSSDIVKIFTT